MVSANWWQALRMEPVEDRKDRDPVDQLRLVPDSRLGARGGLVQWLAEYREPDWLLM